MNNPFLISRRTFLHGAGLGLGSAALATLLAESTAAAAGRRIGGLSDLPHHQPTAKRVIFLHQAGAPSQLDLFDYKPELTLRHGTELPDSIRRGQRLTTMTSEQEKKPLTQSLFRFDRHGRCGAEISELLPYTAEIVDDLCFVKSLCTDAINHDPAFTFIQTGSEQPGRPSMGAWVSYGLGSETRDLPAFVVLVSGGEPRDQPLFGRLWGSGFLPSQHQGVRFRNGREPVLYINRPPGVNQRSRQMMIERLAELNRVQYAASGDPEIPARIEQYELATRMQLSVPGLVDTSDETEAALEMYGDDVRQPGTFAANCLLARRLVERGTRFVQLYHRGWDHHINLPNRIRKKCRQTDQASAALITDLKQRGLLDDTLVIWAGEFGRSAYCQGTLTAKDYGRDHHPRCFTIWMAGGGVKAGTTYGATDDFSYNITSGRMHVHDLQATILHCLGIDHERLTFRFQGRDYRLTDVHGKVVRDVLA